ncbi:MCE family protein [Nonomuraea sp. NBC_01738]|uniref:MlaD family protein n=1 Tax=Nonomuraea sp. NBC_01738 TaxID=2976003 RepID=UPI002E15DB19|nr:MCE family protein [Nonomuraea sp. NBC_01738]
MTLRAKLALFLAISVLATCYTLVRYARIGADLFEPVYRVSADLADAAGLSAHAEVTYRGVGIGHVESLTLPPGSGGVTAVLRLRDSPPVPSRGLRAVVANRSGVGEQYLDLQPSGTAQPYLKEGDRIVKESTTLPITTARVLTGADKLLASLDPRDVATVVTELDHAFGDQGPHLRRLLDASDQLLAGAEEVFPETVTLIGDGRIVLDTQRAEGGHLKAFARDLASLTASLKAGSGDLARVIDRAPRASRSAERLVGGLAPHLRPLLTNLVTGGQVVSARTAALRQLLIGFPAGVAAAFTVVDREGLHFGLNLNLNVPPPCETGYAPGRRYPQDTKVRAARLDTYCREPRESRTGVRGSRNAPRPGTPASIPGLEEWLAGYDPAIGKERSWQALLLGPLG